MNLLEQDANYYQTVAASKQNLVHEDDLHPYISG